MSKTLYFEGAGCVPCNDVENCRIRTAFINDNNEKIYLEMFSGTENIYREYGKRGQKLKHPKWEKTGREIIVCDFCHYITLDKDDCNESTLDCERKQTYMEYTKENILKFVNEKCNCSFDEVKILPRFSGYYVHTKTENGCNKYWLMDDYVDIPERTAERNRVYKEDAKKYFDEIYKKHLADKPHKAYLFPKYESYSLVSMDDKTMTIRSYTYAELIDDNERTHTFEINY